MKKTTIINKSSEEITKKMLYAMTSGNQATAVKEIEDGEIIKVKDFVVFISENEDGEETELLSFITESGEVYTTNSQTFMNAFMDVFSIFSTSEVEIVKKSGTSKAGRKFVTCELVM